MSLHLSGPATPHLPTRDARIATLFDTGEPGLWLDVQNTAYVYADTGGSAPAGFDVPVAHLADRSGNDVDMVQATSSRRAMLRDQGNGRAYLEFDLSDDRYAASIPALSGTMIVATLSGVFDMDIARSSGSCEIGPFGMWNELLGVLMIDRALSASERRLVQDYYIARGAPENPILPSNVFSWFSSRSEVRHIDISDWDLSGVTNAERLFRFCTGMDTIEVGSALANSPNTNYNNAFQGCSLDQASVDTLLIEVEKAGTAGGFLGIYGGTNSPPSTAGLAAKALLELRGWAVGVNS